MSRLVKVFIAILFFSSIFGSDIYAGRKNKKSGLKKSKYNLTVTSDRDEYIAGMDADFAINLTKRNGRSVNPKNLYLYATYPNSESEVNLKKVTSKKWSYEADLTEAGEKILTVELRKDLRPCIKVLENLIIKFNEKIAYYNAKKLEYEALYQNSRKWWKKYYYKRMISQCERMAFVYSRVINNLEKQISFIEKKIKEPLALSSKTILVLNVPVPVITSPAAGAYINNTLAVKANPSWLKGGKLTLIIDGNAEAFVNFTAAGKPQEVTVNFDSTKLTDGEHLISVNVEPAGFTTEYSSAEIKINIDNTSPSITDFSPEKDKLLVEQPEKISVSLSDAGSGLDTENLSMTFDGQKVTAVYNNGKYSYTLPQELEARKYTAKVTASDNAGNNAVAEWSFTVSQIAVNKPPVAQDANLTTEKNAAKTLTLSAADEDNDELTYIIITQSQHGILTGVAPELTYTPNNNYSGADSFTFKANDGTVDSNIATVSILVNNAPVTQDINSNTTQDTAVEIILIGTDANGNELIYSVTQNPQSGTVTLNDDKVTYTPNAGFSGVDTFKYKSNDGFVDSNEAIVSIIVNNAPVTQDINSATTQETEVEIILLGTDINNNALTYTIAVQSQNGQIALDGDKVTYTPNANFSGIDTFKYKVNDDYVDSNESTVTIIVNNAPVATDNSITTEKDTAVAVVLSASDLNGDALTYSIVAQPQHGTLTGDAPNLTFTPAADYNGTDTFTFKANDGKTDSNTATISILINNAPLIQNINSSTTQGTAVEITLIGTDANGNELTYIVTENPQNGTVVLDGDKITYTPNAGFSGTDIFKYKTNDGYVDSNISAVNIVINNTPVATDSSVNTEKDTAVSVILSANDLNGDELTYSIVTQPQHGVLTGNAPNLTFTPVEGYNGSDSFTFKVTDGVVDSNTATVSILVNNAPVTQDVNSGTTQDTTVEITLVGTDANGNALTYVITENPQNGTATLNDDKVTYTPNAGFSGTDNFKYKANDGYVDSNISTVTVVINNAPVATDSSVTTEKDIAIAVVLSANDLNGDALTYTIIAQPQHGTLTGAAPNLTYTPVANYSGADSFTFKVNDDVVDSNTATISILINNAPVTQDINSATTQDTAVEITLVGTDANGNELIYSITENPQNGTATLNGDKVTYDPNADFSGTDTFKYKVNDGFAESNISTVKIIINDAPVASDASITTKADTAAPLTLSANDLNGDALTYTIIAQPQHGTLTGTAPNLTYTPTVNYNGTDSFTFKVNDGVIDSNIAIVSILVNNAPVTQDVNSTTTQDTAVEITLLGTDANGNELIYSIKENPQNGAATLNGDKVTYTPAAGFSGIDTFKYKVNDGYADSNESTVIIVINNAPAAIDSSITTEKDTAAPATLSASDLNGDALTYTIVTQPQHGTLTGTAPNLTYIPAADYSGSDSFTFKANDGVVDSNTATVSVFVNNAPVTQDVSSATTKGKDVEITLIGTDANGNELTYSITENPQNGTVALNGDKVTYTPNADFSGTDTFKYKANDGYVDSNESAVAIVINDAPVAEDNSLLTEKNTAISATLSATDLNGDALTYSIVTGPQHGTLTGTAPNLTYTPNNDYSGADSFTFKVNDGTIDSNTATVSILINNTPVTQDVSTNTSKDTAAEIILLGSDANNNELTYSVTEAPQNGTAVINGDKVTYTPNAGFSGTDIFKYKVNDGYIDSNESTVTITVTEVDVITGQNTPVDITLTGGTAGSIFSIVENTKHGTLALVGSKVTYTPNQDFNGLDSFTYKITEGSVAEKLFSYTAVYAFFPSGENKHNIITVSETSSPETITVSILVNDAPVTEAVTANTLLDTAVEITLAGSDLNGNTLTYSITELPGNGTVVLNGDKVTYTPNAGFDYIDSFKYKVNDGFSDSNESIVTVEIGNTTPTADPQFSVTPVDTAVNITLTGTDLETPQALGFSVTAGPEHGTLTGTAPDLTYTPEAGYYGTDTFSFKADDGELESIDAVVTIKINRVPEISPVELKTGKDTPVTFTLSGIDHDQDDIRFSITTHPASGSICGKSPEFTYTPTAGFSGTDTFEYKAYDGYHFSSSQTVTVLVNNPPVATSQQVIQENAGSNKNPITITLSGTDPNNDSLSYTIVNSPSQGTLSGSGAVRIYTPNENHEGKDSFTFAVNDGKVSSSPVRVDIVYIDTTVSNNSNVIYVNGNATGNNNGTSWQDAFTSLQTAIDSAAEGKEIWVAGGTYYPEKDSSGNASPLDSRTKTFVVQIKNIALYGGFAGTEIYREQRIDKENETILSGDLGVIGDSSDNAYHVLYYNYNNYLAGLTIDGLTITDGNANGPFSISDSYYGGGLFCSQGLIKMTSCLIKGNASLYGGGGAYYKYSSGPVFNNCTFSNNTSGGLYISSGVAEITGCKFSNNTGYGAYLRQYAILVNNMFTGNTGDGLTTRSSNIVNCVFAGNGLSGISSTSYSTDLYISNCTIADNSKWGLDFSAAKSGKDIVKVANTILWNNSLGEINTSIPVNAHSCNIEKGINGSKITGEVVASGKTFNIDPQFVSASDFNLKSASPCIDAGMVDGVMSDMTDIDNDGNNAEPIGVDIAGNIRMRSGIPDIGAYESNGGNRVPTAVKQTVFTSGGSVNITLSGLDKDGDTLTYSVAELPRRGSISGTLPNITYTPNGNFTTVDNFTFTVTDGVSVSEEAVVAIVKSSSAPLNIPGCMAWFDMENGSRPDSKGGIKLIIDQSGNNCHASQPEESFRPVLQSSAINNRNALRFDGNDDFLRLMLNSEVGSNFTAFTVASMDRVGSGTKAEYVFSSSPVWSQSLFEREWGTSNFGFGNAGWRFDGQVYSSTPFLACAKLMNDSQADMYLNGEHVDWYSNSSIDPYFARRFGIGTNAIEYNISVNSSEWSATNPYLWSKNTYKGVIGEIILYSRALSDSERSQVQSYLSSRWGINLAGTAPIARGGIFDVPGTAPVAVTLDGIAANSGNLTYTVLSSPSHGTLTGTASNLTYQPNGIFHGIDSFTWKVTESGVSSSIATVKLVVNNLPVAHDRTYRTAINKRINAQLTGTDSDGDNLIYNIVDKPDHGLLTGNAPDIIYIPDAGYKGEDEFTYTVKDGFGESNTATISIIVDAPPVANDQVIVTSVDTNVSITCEASDDYEYTNLTWTLIDNPKNGTLTGTLPNMVYSPANGYTGADNFTFKVNDGNYDSNIATVTIAVGIAGTINGGGTTGTSGSIPVVPDRTLTIDDGSSLDITLTATGGSGNYTFHIESQPTSGSLSGSGNTVIYTPADGFTGTDTFNYKANDGNSDSNTGTITLHVTAGQGNRDPDNIFISMNPLEVGNDTVSGSVLGAVSGTDPDGDALTFSLVSQSHPGYFELSATAGAPVLKVGQDAEFNYDSARKHTVSICAEDGNGGLLVKTFTIYVRRQPPYVWLELTVGDPSGSHSEQWSLTAGPNTHTSPVGQTSTSDKYPFEENKSYSITLNWLQGQHDYDYEAYIGGLGNGSDWITGDNFLLYDKDNLLGNHGDVDWNTVKDYIAKLYVCPVKIESDIDYDGDMDEDDYKQKDIGAGLILPINDDNDDESTEPENGKEIDNTNSRIDGDEDRADLRKVKVSIPMASELLTTDLPENVTINLSWSKEEGSARIFDTDDTEVLAPNAATSYSKALSNFTEAAEFYVEGVTTGSVEIKVSFIVDGSEVSTDYLTISVIKMEFVVPGTSYYNPDNPDYNAEPVPTDFVGVSDPRPTILLTKKQVKIVNDEIVFTYAGEVRDPIADNIPRGGGADIENIKISVGDQLLDTVAIAGEETEGEKAFWRQHPYRGTFSGSVTLPLTESTTAVRFTTSKNAAGNDGFAIIKIDAQKRVVPGTTGVVSTGGTTVFNICFTGNPTNTAADSVQFFAGDRTPKTEDPVFTEKTGGEASLIFEGNVENIRTLIEVNEYKQGSDWVTPIGGEIPFAADVVDEIKATVIYYDVVSGDVMMTLDEIEFIESDVDSGVFRGEVVSVGGESSLPYTVTENIYLNSAPTPNTIDTIKFFTGEREPEAGDSVATEKQGEADSLTFYEKTNIQPTRITITNFSGLTSGIDTLTAEILYFYGNEMILVGNFIETSVDSGLFKAAIQIDDGNDGQITVIQNLFFDDSPTEGVVDSLKYFTGDREATEDDLKASELVGSEDSLIFFDNTVAQSIETESNGSVITIKNLPPLTNGIDEISASISYNYPVAIRREGTFVETSNTSNVFRCNFTINPPMPVATKWAVSIANGSSNGIGDNRFATVRIIGIPDNYSEDFSVSLAGKKFKLEKHNGNYYLQGGSLYYFNIFTSKTTGQPVVMLYDSESNVTSFEPLAENQINAAQSFKDIEIFDTTASFLLLNMTADINNDGNIDLIDDAHEYPLTGLAEFMRPNNDVSNGSPDNAEDDDLQTLQVALIDSHKGGQIWFNSSNLDILNKLSFYSDKAATKSITFPIDIKAGESLPGTVYMRYEGNLLEEINFTLKLCYGQFNSDNPNDSKIWIDDKMLITLVKEVGDKNYFAAARDYIMENKSRFFTDSKEYNGANNSESVIIVVMRQEATSLNAFDAYNSGEDSINTIAETANSAGYLPFHVAISGGYCQESGGILGDISKQLHGTLVHQGVRASISKKTPHPNLAASRYVAQKKSTSSVGSFIFGTGSFAENGGDIGISNIDNGIDGLLAKESSEGSAAMFIGEAPVPGAANVIFVAGTDVNKHGEASRILGAAGLAKEATGFRSDVGKAKATIFALDGGSSVALGYSEGTTNESFKVKFAAGKHDKITYRYRINNYLLFYCRKP